MLRIIYALFPINYLLIILPFDSKYETWVIDSIIKQDRQWKYDVTLRRVSETVVAVEKQ